MPITPATAFAAVVSHVIAAIALVTAPAGAAFAQELAAAPAPQDQMGMSMTASTSSPWRLMQDGAITLMVNRQGGPRGGSDVTAPNWWMGMATRAVGRQRLTFDAMFSLDPATIGMDGYHEIFQVGEALHGVPLIDRQHPHDFFMQLAAVWRMPLGDATGLTIAGGPAGEAALGPVAFMHRASAAGLPMAPLSHHTFDSTHVSFGVVTLAIDHGPVTVEGSIFNGREPDEHRWDFDFGKLDSYSGRLWYRPNDDWELQVSTGHLVHPEELEPGNVQRTTASASWTTHTPTGLRAMTIGYGANATDDTTRQAVFGEFTIEHNANAVFGRVEALQLESALLLTGRIPSSAADAAAHHALSAITVGASHNLASTRSFEASVGAETTFYAVPAVLQPAYGAHPASFQIFFRLKPPTGSMGRMWNMRMSQPMAGHHM